MGRVACCREGCGAVVCFDDATEGRLRRTHESWVCPFGHSQHFVEKTADQRKIEWLEGRLRFAQERIEHYRAVANTCPWPECGGEFRDLRRHMQRVHEMPTLAAVREQEEAS